jgi:hypothetical protein
MWNKKLQILRSIVDSVKIEQSHSTGQRHCLAGIRYKSGFAAIV